jgi:hypothetical protein
MVVEKRIEANNAPIDAEAVDVETVENITPDVVMTEDSVER